MAVTATYHQLADSLRASLPAAAEMLANAEAELTASPDTPQER